MDLWVRMRSSNPDITYYQVNGYSDHSPPHTRPVTRIPSLIVVGSSPVALTPPPQIPFRVRSRRMAVCHSREGATLPMIAIVDKVGDAM